MSARDLLEQWCAALARGDVEACIDLLAEDVAVCAPLAPPPIPRQMDRDTLAGALRTIAPLFAELRWTALELHAGADPAVAFGTGSAAMTLPDGSPYTQDYAFFVRARDGRIAEYRELMDPIRAQAAVAALAPQAG